MIDFQPLPGITVRRESVTSLPATLFVGGWRVGEFKTERGLAAAISRNKEYGEQCALRLASAAAARCTTCGARGDAHSAPFGGGFMPADDWHARNGAAAPATTPTSSESAPINAASPDCRRASPASNPFWCATHRREHEPRPMAESATTKES